MEASVRAEIDRLYEERDRAHMAPTIAGFAALAAAHPDDAEVVYELAGAHDTAGEEAEARGLYERALALGLEGDVLGRCLLQYGSTLRNLGEHAESLAAFARAREEFPDSLAVRAFQALSLHAAGDPDAALGELLVLLAETAPGDLARYRVALAGYGAELLGEA